jgi:tRNA-specific 2-thiouridylase
MGLVVADKPDSQDICFVPEGRYTSVVERLRPGASEPGEIVSEDGEVLGRHAGIIHYTVGQRRGLGIGGQEDPLYVVRLDAARRQVVVGTQDALLTERVHLKEVNWIGEGDRPADGERVRVKLRSTRPPSDAALSVTEGTVSVVLDTPEKGVAPGQACVFYAPGSDRVLGGGWITATQAARKAA